MSQLPSLRQKLPHLLDPEQKPVNVVVDRLSQREGFFV
jgi:hypothetical protein